MLQRILVVYLKFFQLVTILPFSYDSINKIFVHSKNIYLYTIITNMILIFIYAYSIFFWNILAFIVFDFPDKTLFIFLNFSCIGNLIIMCNSLYRTKYHFGELIEIANNVLEFSQIFYSTKLKKKVIINNLFQLFFNFICIPLIYFGVTMFYFGIVEIEFALHSFVVSSGVLLSVVSFLPILLTLNFLLYCIEELNVDIKNILNSQKISLKNKSKIFVSVAILYVKVTKTINKVMCFYEMKYVYIICATSINVVWQMYSFIMYIVIILLKINVDGSEIASVFTSLCLNFAIFVWIQKRFLNCCHQITETINHTRVISSDHVSNGFLKQNVSFSF